jgi:hypothetical protein
VHDDDQADSNQDIYMLCNGTFPSRWKIRPMPLNPRGISESGVVWAGTHMPRCFGDSPRTSVEIEMIDVTPNPTRFRSRGGPNGIPVLETYYLNSNLQGSMLRSAIRSSGISVDLERFI